MSQFLLKIIVAVAPLIFLISVLTAVQRLLASANTPKRSASRAARQNAAKRACRCRWLAGYIQAWKVRCPHL